MEGRANGGPSKWRAEQMQERTNGRTSKWRASKRRTGGVEREGAKGERERDRKITLGREREREILKFGPNMLFHIDFMCLYT